jgi:ribose transport system substrate-binding protein
VVQEPYKMGYGAVEMMLNLLKGKTVPPIVHTKTSILTAEDLPLGPLGRLEENK